MSQIEQLKKKYKNDVVIGTQPKIERVPTQVAGLDYLLGGGLPLGRLVEIYGPEDVGKTVTSITMIRAMQAAGKLTAFIDAERKFDHTFAESLGVDLDSLVILKPVYGEQAFEFIKDAGDSDISLVIIDSLPLLSPKSVVEKQSVDPTRVDMASVSGMYNRLKEYLIRVTNERSMCVVGINQVRTKFDGYPGWSVPCGQALKHAWSVRLELSKDSLATKERLETYEYPEDTKAVKVTCRKNHTARRSNRSLLIDVGPNGIDKASSLLDLAILLQVVSKSGSWLNYKDLKIHGRNKLLSILREDQDIFQSMYKDVMALDIVIDPEESMKFIE